MNGVLEHTDLGPRLRFARVLTHSPETVWRALTAPEQLRAWFPDTIVVERWEVGAPLRFEHGPTPDASFDGEVLACEPPRLLEFTWGPDVLRFELEAHEGGTKLTLLDTIDQLGKAARDSAGWHACLDDLQHQLDQTVPAKSQKERWQALHAGYVEQFGAEASSIGPPAGAFD